MGPVPSPFDCFLANRGLKTLHVRMREHARNALAVAKFLQGHPNVQEVIYPGMLHYFLLSCHGICVFSPLSQFGLLHYLHSGLPSHPQHELAKQQCKGFGGMVSFRIKGDLSNAKKFLSCLKVLLLIWCLPVLFRHLTD
jgi:cystathionine gamma-lyase